MRRKIWARAPRFCWFFFLLDCDDGFGVTYAAASPSLGDDFDACRRSIASRVFAIGGEEGLDGGDVAKLSRSSRLARALQSGELAFLNLGDRCPWNKQSCNPHLKAFIEDAASLSSFLSFPAGGVPVRLLVPLSSPPRTRLPPGPRVFRLLLREPPNMLEGPKDMG
jgi:hypothetical protein